MKNETKRYLTYVAMALVLIIIAYEWVCGGVLLCVYQDLHNAIIYILKGCGFLIVYLIVLYHEQLSFLRKKQ